ncbi:MAG TPA: metal-sensitive transcriptional regulator [Planctomycetota bacterium]|nr:metal-sensitive transcriptional regulator [Planctomycetota bacterium]
MLDGDLARKLDRRLLRIEGQLRGIRKMIEEHRYCVDVLDQLAAARSGLGAVGQEILRNHISTCVTSALVGKDEKDRQEKIDELIKLFPRSCRGG